MTRKPAAPMGEPGGANGAGRAGSAGAAAASSGGTAGSGTTNTGGSGDAGSSGEGGAPTDSGGSASGGSAGAAPNGGSSGVGGGGTSTGGFAGGGVAGSGACYERSRRTTLVALRRLPTRRVRARPDSNAAISNSSGQSIRAVSHRCACATCVAVMGGAKVRVQRRAWPTTRGVPRHLPRIAAVPPRATIWASYVATRSAAPTTSSGFAAAGSGRAPVPTYLRIKMTAAPCSGLIRPARTRDSCPPTKTPTTK